VQVDILIGAPRAAEVWVANPSTRTLGPHGMIILADADADAMPEAV